MSGPWAHYLHLEHRGVDVHELGGLDLRSYRRLILWLGTRTLKRRQFQKALDILEPVVHLRDVTYYEMFALATAHWYLAMSLKDSIGSAVEKAPNIVFHYKEAKRLLERAITSPNCEALAHFALGYVYDELDDYKLAIVQNQIAARTGEEPLPTWGHWSIAVSRLHQKDPARAIRALRRIRSDDDYWQEIWEDEELAALHTDPTHKHAFENLYLKSLWEQVWK